LVAALVGTTPLFFKMAFEPGEIEGRFGSYFEVERYAGETHATGFPRGWAVYLMTRKGDE
jgi:hypothetical protein